MGQAEDFERLRGTAKPGPTLTIRMPTCGVEGETPQEGEWPKHETVPFAREIPVTPEMVAAGAQELAVSHNARISDSYWARRVYSAMHALAPVELVSVGELEAVRERDEALESVAFWKAEAKRLADGPPIAITPAEVARFWMDNETANHGTRFHGFAQTRLREVIRAARLHGRQSVVVVSQKPMDEQAERDAALLRATGKR